MGSLFIDKMDKAKSEMERTNQRLTKLTMEKAKMEQASALMAQFDQPRTIKQSHSEYKLKINKMLEHSRSSQTLSDEELKYVTAQDAALEIQILKITGIPASKYNDELLSKAYVRVLLEDDTFVTGFGKKSKDGETIVIEWNQPLYFKINNPSKDPSQY